MLLMFLACKAKFCTQKIVFWLDFFNCNINSFYMLFEQVFSPSYLDHIIQIIKMQIISDKILILW